MNLFLLFRFLCILCVCPSKNRSAMQHRWNYSNVGRCCWHHGHDVQTYQHNPTAKWLKDTQWEPLLFFHRAAILGQREYIIQSVQGSYHMYTKWWARWPNGLMFPRKVGRRRKIPWMYLKMTNSFHGPWNSLQFWKVSGKGKPTFTLCCEGCKHEESAHSIFRILHNTHQNFELHVSSV